MTPFTGQFVAFIILNLLVILTAFIITLRLDRYRIRSFLRTTVMVTLIVATLITCSVILLGMIGFLNFKATIIFHTVLAGTVFALWGIPAIRQWKNIFEDEELVRPDWMLLASVFSPVAIIAFVRFFNAVFQVPVEYDNLAYHLPFVVDWMQKGHIWDVYYSAYAGPLGYYPSNFELFDLWVMLPFNSDLLVNMLNLPIFLILPLLLYKVARNFTVGHKASLLVVALFMVLPVTLRQLGTPLVDLYFCFTFLLSLFFYQEYRKSHSLVDIGLAGLALGLFMGTKYLGIIYALPLVLLYAITALWVERKRLSRFFLGALVFALTATATGGFWYIRNWIDSGNPIFPTEVTFMGNVIFGGYHNITQNLIDTSLATNIPAVHSIWYFFEGIFLMLGWPMTIMLLSALTLPLFSLFSVVWSFFHKDIDMKAQHRRYLIIYVLLILLAIFYAIGYWVSPYSFKDLLPNVRYAMMFILVTLLAYGLVMTRLKPLQPLFFFVSFACIFWNIVYLVLFPPLSMLINERVVVDFDQIVQLWPYALLFAVILYGIGLLIASIRFVFNHPKTLPILGMLALSIGFLSFLFFYDTRTVRESLRVPLYTEWYSKNLEWISLLSAAEWFNTNAPQASIAYTGFNMHYPFFGRELERKVEYINVNECLDCVYKDYKDSEESIRRDAVYQDWKNNLVAKKKDYIVLKRGNFLMYELGWMKDHPENFTEVFRAEDVSIYKFTPESI